MRRLSTTSALGAATLLYLTGCAAPHKARVGAENPVVRLQRDMTKVERAIEATKRLLALAHSAPYVPDLYLRLAELYAEQSRYQYLIAYESDKRRSKAVVSIPARILKQQAVQLYDRVTREFPDFPELDKALFFKGHELRELGDYDEMLVTFERLVREYPRSAFRHQALIIIGDYHFDKGNFPRAEEQYKKVLADNPDGPQHAMARYKMAWSRQNQDDCKGALSYFEATARSGVHAQAPGAPGEPRGAAPLNLRREALVDSGFCFTEARKPEEAVAFYRGLADSRAVYLAALSRLARRYHSKGNFRAAAPLYREVLEVDPAHEDALEFVPRFHEGLIKAPSPATVDRDVDVIVRVTEVRYFDPRTSDAVRKAMVHDFEVYSRDLATKAQLATAEQSDAAAPLGQIATAYERYLSFFRDVLHVTEAKSIEANLADVLLRARRLIDAGRAYEAVAQRTKDEAERKGALFSAAAAYTQALQKSKLNNYEQVSARAGLYRAGRELIARYPQAENLRELKFNIANSLYNEGLFPEAISRFTSIFEQYPDSKEGEVAAQLTLDSYRLLYDMDGLVRAGQRFLAGERIKSAALRQKLQETVTAAQQRQLDVLTMAAGTSSADSLLSFAEKNAGSAVGEKALLNAFAAARDRGDLAQLIRIGDQFLQQYPKSADLVGILGTLGKLTAQAAQFDAAARYLNEAAAREATSARGAEMVRTATVLYAQRGDRRLAEESLQKLQQSGAPAALVNDAQEALADLYRRAGDSAALQALGAPEQRPAAALRMEAIRLALSGGGPAELQRYAAELRQLAGSGGDTGAEARLWLADLAAAATEEITFTKSRAEDGKVIARRFNQQGQAEAQYLAVVKLQRPRFVIAALGRLAQLYQGGAKFLHEAPLPAGLNEEATQRYQAAFQTKAKPLLDRAAESLRACAESAGQLKVFSAAAKACSAGQLPPRHEPLPPAVAPRPSQPDAPKLLARLMQDPGDGEALVQLALLHLKAGDVYGAKLVADRAVELGGSNAAAAHNLVGVCAYRFGEHDEAARHFQEALKLDRRSPRARYNLAALYREYGYGKLAAAELPGAPEAPPPELRGDAAILEVQK